MATGKKAAHIAGKLLEKKTTSKPVKTVSASALSDTKKPKPKK